MVVKRCLVTGYTGFIGSHIVESLQKRGVSILGLTRQSDQGLLHPDVEVFHSDLTRPETLAGAANNIDTIIHVAGHAHSTGATSLIHQQTTVEGTRHLLADAVRHGVQRFIFISSIKAMPDPGTYCLDESANGMPHDEYGLSRWQAEELVLEAGHTTGMHVCILRPALVYGPGCKGNLFSMLRWIDRGLFPPIPDTGNRRSMVDVRDLVRAILLAAEKPSANRRTFIITDGEDYSTRRIYTAMRTAFGKPVPRWHVPAGLLRVLGKAGDSYEAILKRTAPFNSTLCSRLLDSACYHSLHAKSAFGFRPEYRLEDALPEMVEIYRQQVAQGNR